MTPFSPETYLTLSPPTLHTSTHLCRIYWFGYQFQPDISTAQRTAFLHWLKGIGEPQISDAQLQQLLEVPLRALQQQMHQIHCILYPGSGRSALVRKMIRTVNRFTAHDTHRLSFELVKQLPAEVGFDFGMLRSECEDENQFAQSRTYVEDVLLPSIRSQSYFSIAACVKPKYRRFMQDYLAFTPEQEATFAKLQGQKLLILDDVATSGATLDEILRIVDRVNPTCEVYLFTLIGGSS